MFGRWLQLVSSGVRGKRAHDARLVALMLTQGIGHVLTLNSGDFTGFAGVTVVHPADIVPD